MAAFGESGTGDWSSWVNTDYKVVSGFVANGSGTISKLTFRCWNPNGVTMQLKGVIYSDLAGQPNMLLAEGDPVTLNGSGSGDGTGFWLDLPFSGANLIDCVNGTTYHLGIITNEMDSGVNFRMSSTSGSVHYVSDDYTDGPSNPFGTHSDNTSRHLCIYATYGGTTPAPWRVAISVFPANSGHTNGTGYVEGYTYDVPSGSSLNVTASPVEAYTFSHWEFNGAIASMPIPAQPDGSNNTLVAVFSVGINPPIANFTYQQPDLQVPTIQFTDTSTFYGTGQSWLWNFGDGETSTSQNPLHVYSSGGIKTVSLTVSDSGGSNGITLPVNVSIGQPSQALYYDDFNSGSLNSSLWRTLRGGNVYQRNGRIEIAAVETGAGIRMILNNTIDFRSLDVRVQRDPRKIVENAWSNLTVGNSADSETGNYPTLTWGDGPCYSFYERRQWGLISLQKYDGVTATPTSLWTGDWQRSCALMRIRIEASGASSYVIRFYEDDVQIYSEDCTWLISALQVLNAGTGLPGDTTPALGRVELFGRDSLAAFDNFAVYSSLEPSPSQGSVVVSGLENGGIVFPAPHANSYYYPEDMTVSVVAIPDAGVMLDGTPQNAYTFNGWRVNGSPVSGMMHQITIASGIMTSVESLGFTRDPTYSFLHIILEPVLGGLVYVEGNTNPKIGSILFPTADSVLLTAKPLVNYALDHWELDGANIGTGTLNPDGSYSIPAILMSADHTVKAVFMHVSKYTLRINAKTKSSTLSIPFQFTKVAA